MLSSTTDTAGFGGLNQIQLLVRLFPLGQLGPMPNIMGSEHLNSCRAVMGFKLKS